jgi:hypothetical protein
MCLKGNTNVYRDERRSLVSCLNHYTSIGLTRALTCGDVCLAKKCNEETMEVRKMVSVMVAIGLPTLHSSKELEL